MRRFAPCLLLLLIGSFELIGQTKVVQGRNLRYRSVIGRLTSANFLRMATEFLAGSGGIAVFSAYGTQRDRLIGGEQGGDHCSYETANSNLRYNAPPAQCPNVQQAIRIGSRVLVRSMNEACHLETHVVRGDSNPLRIAVAGTPLEIVDIQFAGIEKYPLLVFFVQSGGDVSPNFAEMITAYLRKEAGLGDVSVVLRPNKWFWSECEFPALFPFDRDRRPTAKQFALSRYAVCNVFDKFPIQCHEYREHQRYGISSGSSTVMPR